MIKIGILKIGYKITYGKNIDGKVVPFEDSRGVLGEVHSIINMVHNGGANVKIFTDMSDNNWIDPKYECIDVIQNYLDNNVKIFDDVDRLIVINGSITGIDNSFSSILLNIANYWAIQKCNKSINYILCDPELPLIKNISDIVKGKSEFDKYKIFDINRNDIRFVVQPHNVKNLVNIINKNIDNVQMDDVVHYPLEKFPCLNQNNSFNKNYCPEYDLMYGGSIRVGRRAEKISKFLYGHKDLKVLLFGKMDKEMLDKISKEHYKTNKFPPKYQGLVPYVDFCKVMNNSLSTIVIGDKIYEDTNDIAQRCYESMMANVVTFIDSELDKDKVVFGDDNFLNYFMYVDDYEQLSERIEIVKSFEEIHDFILNYQQKIISFDKKEYCKNFLKILK